MHCLVEGYETKQDIGISRGGRNTKIHAIVNESVCVVSFLLTPGNIHDSKPSIELALQIDLKDVILRHRRVFVFKVRQNPQKFLIQEGKRVFS